MAADANPVEVTADEVKRLRDLSGMPGMTCKQFLAELPSVDRARLFQSWENQSGNIFFDPIAYDPAIKPLFDAICREVADQVAEEQRQRIAKLEQECPTVADMARTGMGLCHRHWHLIKRLMRERHGIEWLSPAELMPWCHFD